MAIGTWCDDILVNAIAPGSIMTDGTRRLYYGRDGLLHKNVQSLIDHIPLRNPGTPEDIAHAALFLAAPETLISQATFSWRTVDGPRGLALLRGLVAKNVYFRAAC